MRNRLPVGILFLFLFPTSLVGFGEYRTGRLVPFAWVSVAAQAIRTELAELNGRQERDLLSAGADCHLKLEHSDIVAERDSIDGCQPKYLSGGNFAVAVQVQSNESIPHSVALLEKIADLLRRDSPTVSIDVSRIENKTRYLDGPQRRYPREHGALDVCSSRYHRAVDRERLVDAAGLQPRLAGRGRRRLRFEGSL